MVGARYAVERGSQEGIAVYTLRDSETGVAASIVPALGANWFRFSVPHGGAHVEAIAAPPDFAALRQRPSGWGTPVLFPFPNRLRQGRFAFQGRTYQLEPNTPQGHHIHGLVIRQPFQVERAEAHEQGAVLLCTLRSRDVPEIERQFPFPFVLRLEFLLQGGRLCQTVDVENTGHGPMPMGFGTHPYFAAPLAPAGIRGACRIQVPAAAYWELDADRIPTGRVLPVEGTLDLRSGRALDDTAYDHVFTALQPRDGWSTCRLEDPAAGLTLVTRAEYPAFREWVVYAPPDRAVVCFEPYTCATDAPHLQARGIDAGLIVLPPGRRWRARIETWVELL